MCILKGAYYFQAKITVIYTFWLDRTKYRYMIKIDNVLIKNVDLIK